MTAGLSERNRTLLDRLGRAALAPRHDGPSLAAVRALSDRSASFPLLQVVVACKTVDKY